MRRSTNRREPSETPFQTEAEVSEIEAAVSSWQAGSEQREPVSQDTTRKATKTQSQVKTKAEKAKEVAEALHQVEQALRKAEDKLEDIPNLPSARPRREVPEWLWSGISIARLSAILAAAIYAHSCGPVVQILSSVGAGAALGALGYRKGSLSASGALAALFVGATTLGSSLRAGITLISFYLSSSKLTRLKEELKEVDDEFKKGGQRNWVQVFCNAFVPAVLAMLMGWWSGLNDQPLSVANWRMYTAAAGAFLGYYSCCCGDTWASEVGQLSEAEPRLITSLRPVRKGTNGGVTLLGIAASAAGGLFIGLVFYSGSLISPGIRRSDILFVAAKQQWILIPLGLVAGLVGSVIDSTLGATVQFTGFNRKTGKITSKVGSDVVHISGFPLLTNNGVNLVSATTCSVLCGVVALRLF